MIKDEKERLLKNIRELIHFVEDKTMKQSERRKAMYVLINDYNSYLKVYFKKKMQEEAFSTFYQEVYHSILYYFMITGFGEDGEPIYVFKPVLFPEHTTEEAKKEFLCFRRRFCFETEKLYRKKKDVEEHLLSFSDYHALKEQYFLEFQGILAEKGYEWIGEYFSFDEFFARKKKPI